MKKNAILICLLCLYGCILPSADDYLDSCTWNGCITLGEFNRSRIANELEEKKDPYLTCKIYNHLSFRVIDIPGWSTSQGALINPDKFATSNSKVHCWLNYYESNLMLDHYYYDKSDECLEERTINKDNPNRDVYFFDYNRFLPDDIGIKTVDDFKLYMGYISHNGYCDEYAIEFAVTNGIEEIKKKKAQQKAQAELEAKQEREKQEQQRIKNRQMCEIYQKCVQEANECPWHEHEKGCRIRIDSDTYVNGIAKKGVFISHRYLFSNMFLYTDKKYVDGAVIDQGFYIEEIGTYEYTTTSGSLNRVYAFKETNIPICDKELYYKYCFD